MKVEITYGYCHCGCGQKTSLYPHGWRRFGWVKGEPRPYRQGHWSRTEEAKPTLRASVKKVHPIRHAQMQKHRKLGPWKAGATSMAKAFLKRQEGDPSNPTDPA